MASTSQALYCFEVLSASFDKQKPPSLAAVQESWTRYEREVLHAGISGSSSEIEPAKDSNRGLTSTLRSHHITRLQQSSPASGLSSSSTPSTSSLPSATFSSHASSHASSRTSLSVSDARSPSEPDKFPLFVTWNTVNPRNGHKSLRGCIGTFEAQPLGEGLESYALTSAFEDTRFHPIARHELASLANSITLLSDFTPCADPLDWELGVHGLRISFHHHQRRYGATYLPDVAPEQGWSRDETLNSLIRKALGSSSGRPPDWRALSDLQCTRYQGRKASVSYETWRQWHTWAENNGLR